MFCGQLVTVSATILRRPILVTSGRGADAGGRFALTPTCAFVRSNVGCRGDACDLPDDVAAVGVVVGTRWPADAQSVRRAKVLQRRWYVAAPPPRATPGLRP